VASGIQARIGGTVKNIIKTGPVRVWILGEGTLIEASPDATDWDLLQAMDAEEELNLYRENAGRN
jgi:hypothetical protein